MKPNRLLTAIEQDKSVEVIDVVIKDGVDKNVTDRNGYTPLMVSVRKSNKAVAQYLIKNGFDVNKRSNLGESALMIAANSMEFRYVCNVAQMWRKGKRPK